MTDNSAEDVKLDLYIFEYPNLWRQVLETNEKGEPTD
jgi:hypothetical protein